MADRSAGDFVGKPRPAVVVQSDDFSETASVVICPFTTDDGGMRVLRIAVRPSETLPIEQPSWIMVEKLTAIRRDRARSSIGRISAAEMIALERSLAVVLGFA